MKLKGLSPTLLRRERNLNVFSPMMNQNNPEDPSREMLNQNNPEDPGSNLCSNL